MENNKEIMNGGIIHNRLVEITTTIIMLMLTRVVISTSNPTMEWVANNTVLIRDHNFRQGYPIIMLT